MEYTIEERLAGTTASYWMLRMFKLGETLPCVVHTRKGKQGYSYVNGIRQRRYPKAIKRA